MYFVLIMIFIIISSFAIAQDESGQRQSHLDHQLSEIYKAEELCFEKAVSNLEMNDCSVAKLRDADALLSKVYRDRTMALEKRGELEKNSDELTKTADETLRRLVEAQKAWIIFRDADCNLQGAEMLHGSGEGLIIQGCLAEKTAKRVKEIAPTGLDLE